MDTTEFIRKARKVHSDKYDYSNSEYTGTHNKIEIICPKHGAFFQTATNHLSGKGCKYCGRDKISTKQRSNTVDFICKARKVHGDQYDYSKVEYVKNDSKVTIICPIHGEFEQTPSGHLSGKGCMHCGTQQSVESVKSRMTLSKDEFVHRAKEKHEGKYDYSKVEYVSNKTKVIIGCPKHGEFEQTPNKHLCGRGCPTCGRERTIKHNFLTLEDFTQKARIVHLDKYDYSNSEYAHTHNKIEIICPKHGAFFQTPHNHLSGMGCPRCSTSVSKTEIKLVDCIRTFYSGEIITNSKNIIPPLELDIYVPALRLAIEYNGGYWHSEKFKNKEDHLHKYNLCKDRGIRLISIWEWEYLKDRTKIENFIKNLISEKIKLQARKLELKAVTVPEQREFLEHNHLQGYVPCTVALGLYQEDELVQLMTLRAKDKKNKVFEIGRLATKVGYYVTGGAERLFKHLKKNLDYSEIISYNNMDKFTGAVYERLGMQFDSITIPYGWISNGKRFLPRYQTQKSKLVKQGYDKNKSESEIMRNAGFEKIYLTGVQKFILKNNLNFTSQD